MLMLKVHYVMSLLNRNHFSFFPFLSVRETSISKAQNVIRVFSLQGQKFSQPENRAEGKKKEEEKRSRKRKKRFMALKRRAIEGECCTFRSIYWGWKLKGGFPVTSYFHRIFCLFTLFLCFYILNHWYFMQGLHTFIFVNNNVCNNQ